MTLVDSHPVVPRRPKAMRRPGPRQPVAADVVEVPPPQDGDGRAGAARALPDLHALRRGDRPLSAIGSAIPAYVAGAPMLPRFFEADGTFHLRPFVYGHKTARDRSTLRLKHEIDTTQIWKLSLFVHGKPYQPARPDPDRHPPVRHDPGLRPSLRHGFHRPRHLFAHHPRDARLARRRIHRRRRSPSSSARRSAGRRAISAAGSTIS